MVIEVEAPFDVDAGTVAADAAGLATRDDETDEEASARRKRLADEAREVKRKLLRRKGRKYLSEFVKQTWAIAHPTTKLEWGPHIQAICDHVQWQLEDQRRAMDDPTFVMRAQNMVLNVAPRSLKTYIMSVATVWAWLHVPSLKIMYLSSNPRVALDSARIARDLILHKWFQDTYQPGWTLRKDQTAFSDLGNTSGGTRAARGLDAQVTGVGAQWLCVARGTKVATEIGDVEIQDLVAMSPRPRAWSRSPDGELELRAITRAWRTGDRETVRVTTGTGHVLRCTDDHGVWTPAGYVEAQDLGGHEVSVLSLRSLPHRAPQSEVCPVTSIERDVVGGRRTTIDVYDITVEGNHNFFADGVLVHNCIDDPHDVRATRADIESVNAGYDAAVHNRINDPRTSIRTVIMQRIAVYDFSANILKTGEWLHVRVPMHYRARTACKCGTCVGVNVFGWRDWRTAEGEVLHPRFTEKFLKGERARLQMSNAGYEAQMDQEPVDLSGGMVQRSAWSFFRVAGELEGDHARPPGCQGTVEGQVPEPALALQRKGARLDVDYVELSIDCANKNTLKGSRYGLLACAVRGERRFVLEDGSRRGSFADICKVIVAMVVRWRPRKLLIEDKAAGPTMIEEMTRLVTEGKIKDENGDAIYCAIEALGADAGGGDKESRLNAVLYIIDARLVYLLEGAPWLKEFVEELSLFPKGPQNDRVDALSQFLARTHRRASMLDVDWRAVARA